MQTDKIAVNKRFIYKLYHNTTENAIDCKKIFLLSYFPYFGAFSKKVEKIFENMRTFVIFNVL
ncbi:MAG: hypothetical protein DBY05_09930 [Clostridiales bacterium]|jgi:hypothetical protein|nr:MAG: hypothetical protein DBY05_09930 [Clostridiales bacterium]